jgi:hypothetical protein
MQAGAASLTCALAAVALPLAAAWIGCSRSDTPRMRIVLVTLDTLRYDRFAGAPETPTRMPLLLGRAQRGSIFSPSAGLDSPFSAYLTEHLLSDLAKTPLEFPLPIRFAPPVTGSDTSREDPVL